MDKKILQSRKICDEIDKNITHMAKLRAQLQQELLHTHSTSRRVEHKKQAAKNHNIMAGRPRDANAKNLPVFVHRRAEKSYPSVM